VARRRKVRWLAERVADDASEKARNSVGLVQNRIRSVMEPTEHMPSCLAQTGTVHACRAINQPAL
jgi:hypothetical protein